MESVQTKERSTSRAPFKNRATKTGFVRTASRAAVSVPVALLLSLLIAGQALAYTWSGPIEVLGSGDGWVRGVVGVNDSTAVAVTVDSSGDEHHVNVRRSTNSGASWGAPTTLSTDGWGAQIAARAPFVDVVWEQDGRARYARSTDGGVSYGASVAISPMASSPYLLAVARGPDGLVVVAWEDFNSQRVQVRVSSDGGATFGPVKSFATNAPGGSTSVAAGQDVVYVAYRAENSGVRVRRSVDAGTTWSAGFIATKNAWNGSEFSLTASGTDAFIAYAVQNQYHAARSALKYRRTVDSGATWSNGLRLAPRRWNTQRPHIELRDGVLRATFVRISPDAYGVHYRESSNGIDWSSPEFIAPAGYNQSVTFAGNVIVLYEDGTGGYIRTGT